MNLTDNPALTPDEYDNFLNYGFHKRTAAAVGPDGMLPDGSEVTWVFPKTGFESTLWLWHPSTYLAAFEAAGFVEVRGMQLQRPPDGFKK